MENKLLLRKSLLLLKLDSSNGTLKVHFNHFDKLFRELRSTGATLEEMDVNNSKDYLTHYQQK